MTPDQQADTAARITALRAMFADLQRVELNEVEGVK